MFLDDSACNLASLNLMKFAPNGTFDVEAYRHACAVIITAQEILVDNSGYPTEAIGKNSHDYRPLGLGYANLGALLMACGPALRLRRRTRLRRLRHRHHVRRSVSAVVEDRRTLPAARSPQPTAVMKRVPHPRRQILATGWAERCPGWYINREPFLDVIRMHRASVNNINRTNVPTALYEASKDTWDEALKHGEKFGYRNAQVTVLAPTGTIGFMMDCDTTGIEPDLALVKYKKLVGGGMIKIVNNTVPDGALQARLHHRPDQRHRQLHRRHRHHRRRARHQGRAPAGLRLLLQADEGHAHHSLPRTPAHDGGGAAVHLGRNLQDHQHARERPPSTRSAKPTSRPGSWA